MREPARDGGDRTTHPVNVLDAPTGLAAPPACLLCVAGDDLGRSVRLDRPVVIGRSGDLQLSATDVSRRHARISEQDGRYLVEDLGSANGTFVDGAPVTGPTVVRIGSTIHVGRTVVLLARYDDLEERVQRVERLETMGTLAGGIAHDFNNALAVIVANYDSVADGLPPGPSEAREALESIRRATASATQLARRLLRLGSRESLSIGIVPLDGLVEHTLGMVRRRSHAAIQIDVAIPPGLAVAGAFDELHQVLVNLYYNACDAMPEGGTFRIAARAVDFDTTEALAHQLVAAGAYVELTIGDTGVGMDPATRARAFEPFFTTKGRDKGTGLGLAMTYHAIRRHGGAIELESELGRGTTFRIYLVRRPGG